MGIICSARAGGKFQPKAKPCGPPRPIKKNSGPSSLPSSEPVRTNDVSESTADECHEKEKPAASGEISFLGVGSSFKNNKPLMFVWHNYISGINRKYW